MFRRRRMRATSQYLTMLLIMSAALAIAASPAKAGDDSLFCKPPLLDAFGGWAYDVAVEDDIAYIAVGVGGLLVADVGDPAAPQILGSLALPERARRIAVENQIACILDDTAMRIVDATDPAHPVIIGTYEAIQDPQRVLVRGDVAYVCDGESGLKLIDIHDPTDPQLLDTLNTNGAVCDIVLTDLGFAFLADGVRGLKVLYVGDPTDIILINSIDYPFAIIALEQRDDHFFLATGYDGMRVLNESLEVAAHFDTTDITYDIATIDDYAYTIDRNGRIKRFNIADPSNPQFMAQDFVVDGSTISAFNGVVYAAGWRDGVAIYTDHAADLTTRAGLVQTTFSGRVELDGDLMYVGGRGLQIFRLNGEHRVELLGDVGDHRFTNDMARSGDFLYLITQAEGPDALQIYNVADPAAPIHTASLQLHDERLSLAVNGATVYVVAPDGFDGIHVIDASDPFHPVEVGVSTAINSADVLTFSNGFLYAAGAVSFYILEPQPPHDFTVLSELPVKYGNGGIKIVDELAYLTTDTFIGDGPGPSMEIIDISNPAAPIHLSHISVGEAVELSIDDDVAFLPGHRVELWDVSNPSSPGLINRMQPVAPPAVFAAPFDEDVFIVTDRGFEIYNFASCFHPACRTDFNADGLTNATDLAMLLSLWHPDGGGFFSKPNQTPDLNADTAINGADLAILLTNWGPCR